MPALTPDTKVWVLSFVGQTHYHEYFLSRQTAVAHANKGNRSPLKFRRNGSAKLEGFLYERPPGFDHDLDRCYLGSRKLGTLLNFNGWEQDLG